MVEQGDIISVNGIAFPLLVVSKNIYNTSGHAIVCPILREKCESTLSLKIETNSVKGTVCCDNPRQIDYIERGFRLKGRVSMRELISAVDMIQALFDYV